MTTSMVPLSVRPDKSHSGTCITGPSQSLPNNPFMMIYTYHTSLYNLSNLYSIIKQFMNQSLEVTQLKVFYL